VVVSSPAFFSPSINVASTRDRVRLDDCVTPDNRRRFPAERKPPPKAREERADAPTVLSIPREGEKEREKERGRVIAPRLLHVTL